MHYRIGGMFTLEPQAKEKAHFLQDIRTNESIASVQIDQRYDEKTMEYLGKSLSSLR
ncbi:MAG: hypothetical protein JEY71_08740 [Sphaerochaeta sp.]|nr:hypothetical protein [Sphaerochaeta sp.]